MPIVWRYLLSHYIKVLLLCLLGFVAILLTTRLDEIAHFATLGPEGGYILLFTLHQIPYILPIALPIACLISSILLVQRLSRTHELTALRSAGLSLGGCLAPILITASLLALGNFYIVSELSTDSHLATGLLKTQMRSINPLLLLHNKHLLKMKGIFLRNLGPSKMGESVEQVLIASPNKQNDRINLLIASKLRASPSKFVGHKVTFISSLGNKGENRSDDIAIENLNNAQMSVQDFGQMLQKKVWNLNNDHLRMPLLLAHLRLEKENLSKASPQGLKAAERCVAKCYSEILRRVSIAFAVFSFTLMGCAYGISISRFHSNRGTFIVIGMAAFVLIAFFVAKGVEDQLGASATLYIAPHLILIAASLRMLRRASQGVES